MSTDMRKNCSRRWSYFRIDICLGIVYIISFSFHLDYSQISDFALRSMECASLLAPSKAVASYRTPKNIAAQEQKRTLDSFLNNACYQA